YDPGAGNFPSATTTVSAAIPRGQVTAGLSISDPSKFTFLQGGFTLNPWPWLTAQGSINWDLRHGTFVENHLLLALHWQCWALAMDYINRRQGEDGVRFTLNLLGVGAPLSTRVGLGAIGGGRTR